MVHIPIDDLVAAINRDSAEWVEIREDGQWKRPPHKTLVWITYSPATDLTSVSFAYWNDRQSKWFWDNESHPVTGYEVLAWSIIPRPKPYTKPDASDGETK